MTCREDDEKLTNKVEIGLIPDDTPFRDQAFKLARAIALSDETPDVDRWTITALQPYASPRRPRLMPRIWCLMSGWTKKRYKVGVLPDKSGVPVEYQPEKHVGVQFMFAPAHRCTCCNIQHDPKVVMIKTCEWKGLKP